MRTVKNTAQDEAELASMRGDYPRVDFAIEGVSPTLLKSPEQFNGIIGRDIKVLKLVAFDGVPDASIYFVFDNDFVTLLSIAIN